MKLLKEYKTISQQNEILKSRGLIVDDETILNGINYSHLIYKFGIIYWDTENDKYVEGTKLSHIYALYNFHRSLTKEIFNLIIKYELKLKAIIASQIAEIDPLWYIDIQNYDKSIITDNDEMNKLYKNMLRLSSKSQYEKYKIERDGISYLPIWLLIDEMAFGQLTMLIKAFGKRNKIFHKMNLNPQHGWAKLTTINYYRNQIFHGNELRSSITNDKYKTTVYLTALLKILKKSYPDDFKLLSSKITCFDYKSINITMIELLSILKISGIFKK